MNRYRLLLNVGGILAAIDPKEKIPLVVKLALASVRWSPCVWAFSARPTDAKALAVLTLSVEKPTLFALETA